MEEGCVHDRRALSLVLTQPEEYRWPLVLNYPINCFELFSPLTLRRPLSEENEIIQF